MRGARDWAIRAMHEKQMHKHSCMITLTYNPEHLPPHCSLHYPDFQAFVRRLRKALGRRGTGSTTVTPSTPGRRAPLSDNILYQPSSASGLKAGIRFYMGGEYGEKYGRPHYHALLYGIDFADRKYHKQGASGAKHYQSETLAKLWGKGFASVGDVTFKSAAYIARYIMSKKTGDGNRKNYNIIDPETGEIYTRAKEFNQMSRRPGLGATWLETYKTDAYPRGKVIINAKEANTPRFYDKKYKLLDRAAHDHLKHVRQLEQLAWKEDQTPARLAVRETVAIAKASSLKRTFE